MHTLSRQIRRSSISWGYGGRRVWKWVASVSAVASESSAECFGGQWAAFCRAPDERVRKDGEEEEEEPSKVLKYLDSLRDFESEGVPKGAGTESDAGFDLGRMARLLRRLGDPLSAYPVVHVAGTKGKGSTVSFLRHILQAAGVRAGSYTSPHITSLRERIVSGETGRPISARAFDQVFEDVHKTLTEAAIAEAGALTRFEVLTALAFLHFARERVDMAVIEAGLGGARDATNVIQASGLLVAVIVGIGEEHVDALGGSLATIANAKAGIIKDGRPVVLAKQRESLAENVIRQVAASKNASVFPQPGLDAVCNLKGICADPSSPHQICDISLSQAPSNEVWTIKDLKIPVLGPHQLENAATAIQAALCLRREGWEISDTVIRLGVENTSILGRFQILSASESKKLRSGGCTVILDGAHTVESARALASTLRETYPNELVAIVVAMASDKDHVGFARAILEGTTPRIIIATEVQIAGKNKRSTPTGLIANSFMVAAKDCTMEILSGGQTDHEWDPDVPPVPSSLSSTQGFAAEISANRHRNISTRNGQRTDHLYLLEASSLQAATTRAASLARESNGSRPGVVVVTGSLHAVSAIFTLLRTFK